MMTHPNMWKNAPVVRVGDPSADFTGFDSNTIQAAANSLREHGGIIILSEGTYEMIGPVRLCSNTWLTGQGQETVLKKSPGLSSPFSMDVDYGVLSAKVVNPKGFKPGSGLWIADGESRGGWKVSTSKVVAVNDDTLAFDRRTVMDYQKKLGGLVTNACSIIEAIKVENVRISNLAIDGSRDSNFLIDGCRGGAIYLHKAVSCHVHDVVVHHYNGDGISWQITEDISVINAEVHHCAISGLHPGTGSDRTAVEQCKLHDNDQDGMFVCWRVQNSRFRDNCFYANHHCGISIGHRDTDNLFESNEICRNGLAGIIVRDEEAGNRADRNIYRFNTIEDNGRDGVGFGILMEGVTEGTVMDNNIIRDTGTGSQPVDIRRAYE